MQHGSTAPHAAEQDACKESPMKDLCIPVVVAALWAAGPAAAQSTPTPPPPAAAPASQSPDSTNPPPRGDATSNGASKSATRAQLKDCMKEQHANNPSLTPSDLRKYCESQLNSTPQG